MSAGAIGENVAGVIAVLAAVTRAGKVGQTVHLFCSVAFLTQEEGERHV